MFRLKTFKFFYILGNFFEFLTSYRIYAKLNKDHPVGEFFGFTKGNRFFIEYKGVPVLYILLKPCAGTEEYVELSVSAFRAYRGLEFYEKDRLANALTMVLKSLMKKRKLKEIFANCPTFFSRMGAKKLGMVEVIKHLYTLKD